MILKQTYYVDKQKQGHIDLHITSGNKEILDSKSS